MICRPRSAALIFACTACASAPAGPLGSVTNPVRCEGKQGEIAYLSRLRCPSGGAPHFHFGQRGPRGPYRNETDRFELRCVWDDRSTRIFVDRHHPGHGEQQPIPGFALAAERPIRVLQPAPE